MFAAKDWPAANVEMRSVKELIPYARNPRKHSDEQVAQLAASIKEFGWTIPVLVDETGTLIAGHGRIMAAQRLGLSEVPTMTAKGWSEAQKRAYVIADNQLTLNSTWDKELLGVELEGLKEMNFNLDLVGFSSKELGSIFGKEMEAGDAPVTDLDEIWAVIAYCKGEQDQAALIERLEKEGYNVKAFGG
ncbi:ParB/Srx family N-terminal domain-containing protein [Hyphomicrobium sp.]|uniref:ParB/Srx family N-terminal domain-containing protein n=1 Tax=Hyphomicrobium sp. TaxID=82 RepID=UPI001DB504A2|nr:ParB/Srx family N-terminal domain-containing protein [Hyphomicrobium sp.]MBY0562457.1 ParB/Srx family N-terminal domain-containing protein [Hyphomicrobium sp.]